MHGPHGGAIEAQKATAFEDAIDDGLGEISSGTRCSRFSGIVRAYLEAWRGSRAVKSLDG
jgi:hypothetical protein